MDLKFERDDLEVLQDRLSVALEAWRSGVDHSAWQQLEDALTALQAQRFGIPKSSITKLWTLERLAVRKTLAPSSAS